MAQWINLCLPSCGLRFKSQVHHRRFSIFHLSNIVLHSSLDFEKEENKQKRAGFGPYKTLLEKLYSQGGVLGIRTRGPVGLQASYGKHFLWSILKTFFDHK